MCDCSRERAPKERRDVAVKRQRALPSRSSSADHSAQAAATWLQEAGWTYNAILDPQLTTANCHGLTFRNGGSIAFNTVESLLLNLQWDIESDWVNDESAPVIVCFRGVLVAHTARFLDGFWRQTATHGPIFNTTKAAILAQYPDSLDLQVLADRQALLARLQVEMAPEPEATKEEIAAWEVSYERFQALAKKLQDHADAHPEYDPPHDFSSDIHYMAKYDREREDLTDKTEQCDDAVKKVMYQLQLLGYTV